MSEEGISYRASLKAAERKFLQEEERIMVGWIIYNDLAMQSTTTIKFREFVMCYFGHSLSASYISKFLHRWHLSMKLCGYWRIC